MKEQIQLWKTVFDFLENLSEHQLELLVNKKAKLQLEVKGEEKDKKSKQKSKICTEEVCGEIDKFTTREQALEYIKGLNLRKPDLMEIAKAYHIPLTSKDTIAKIIDKIVENVVGAKLKFDTLLNTNLGKND